MSETIPDLPVTCWPVDWSCVPGSDELSAEVKARAAAMATSALRALSGYRVGSCPIVIRPCSKACASSGEWYPFINSAGTWVNGCGCVDDCSCGGGMSEIILPGPVGGIVEVTIDGSTVIPSLYRVDNGNRLVRTDGVLWPACQDMAAADDEVGSFAVTYLRGLPVDGLASNAAGLLAGEFAKACGGQQCALPRNVSSLARQGVTMEIIPGTFPGGSTGIFVVDAWLRTINPYGQIVAPAVYSPDDALPRRTTWAF